VRVQGDPVDVAPPSSTLLKNKARRWMVREDWLQLEENKGFDVPSRIADNGKAWGDPEDPEEIEAKQKRVKEEKEELKRKRPKLEDSKGKQKENMQGSRRKVKRGRKKRKTGTTTGNAVAGSSKSPIDPQLLRNEDDLSSTDSD
jgi:hypothetical protein